MTALKTGEFAAGDLAPAANFDPNQVFLGPRDCRPRLLQTMLRVADLDSAVALYVEGLGMSVLERFSIDDRGIHVAFVGYAGTDTGSTIELVRFDSDTEPYVIGEAFGHVAVTVTDIAVALTRLTAVGATMLRPPEVLAPGGPVCAFAADRDGYAIELMEASRPTAGAQADPAAALFPSVILGPDDGRPRMMHTMLRVGDLARALDFYVDGLGMTELARLEVPINDGVTVTFVSFDADEPGRQLELVYHAGAAPTHGTGYGHVGIAVRDLPAVLARLTARGVPCPRPPHKILADAPGVAFVTDPDGRAVELVQTWLA